AMQLIGGVTFAALLQANNRRNDKSSATPPDSPVTSPYLTVGSPEPSRPSSSSLLAASGSRDEYHRAVARAGADVADALDHAHGVIHRDVKPGNLMIEPDGHVWITDFGLAHLAGDENLTRTGDLVGTLRYVSPEQLLGRRVPIDHRTDVYSLGVTLYEMLTGR